MRGVWATVWEGEKCIPTGIGKAGTYATKQISRHAIFQRRGCFRGKIFVGSADAANGNQIHSGVGGGGDEKRQKGERNNIFSSHSDSFLMNSVWNRLPDGCVLMSLWFLLLPQAGMKV